MVKWIDLAVVAVSGPADIKTAAKLHLELLRALQNHEEVEINADQAVDIDLTFVQLVESARQFAATQGRTLRLAKSASGRLLEILRRGGFLRDGVDRCFWLNATGAI